jgi:N-acetylglutamate synthase-like GNAT family acetyltransferase
MLCYVMLCYVMLCYDNEDLLLQRSQINLTIFDYYIVEKEEGVRGSRGWKRKRERMMKSVA